MRYDEDTKLLLTEVHDHAAHDAAALPDASFFPDNLLLPAGGRNDSPDRHARAHAAADRRAAPAPIPPAVPESALAPFNVVLPEDAHVEMAEGRITLVRGDSRVVAMVISRVPDEDPAAALPVLMQDFDPKTSETMDFDAQPGFCILGGVVNDAFGDGEDKITLMVLADSGELLILSGYNLARDHHALYLFLTELLENVSMDGAAVYVAEDAAATASPEA